MDPALRKQILSRVDQGQGRTPLFLYVIGLLLVVLSVVGLIAGQDALPGFVPHLFQLCVGVLFLYIGALVQERQRLSYGFRELVDSFEAFNQTIYGKDYKVQRQAVEILVATLRSDDPSVREKVHAQLVRITGQQLPSEPEPWEQWWAQNKATFSRPGADAAS